MNCLLKVGAFGLLLLLHLRGAYGQYIIDTWPLGFDEVKLVEVGSNQELVIPDSIRMGIGYTLLEDEDGELICLTTGSLVYNPDMQLMKGGDTLSYTNFMMLGIQDKGLDQPQSSLLLPFDKRHIGLVHYDKSCHSCPLSELKLARIDMTHEGGLGEVVSKDQLMISDALSDYRMTACRHANGRDWWVLKGQDKENTFHTFLLTPDSFYYHGIQQFPDSIAYAGFGPGPSDHNGCRLIFNKAGDLMVSSLAGASTSLFNFDRCTGQLSMRELFLSGWTIFPADTIQSGIGTMSFSPNDRYLFGLSHWGVYRYDVTAVNVRNTETIILYMDTTGGQLCRFHGSGVAPNGKLYIGYIDPCGGYGYVSNPNEPDTALLNWVPHGLNVMPAGWLHLSFPDYPNYNLGALPGPCDTLTGLQEQQQAAAGLWVWPNPTNGIVTIEAGADVMLTVTDLNGKVVYGTNLGGFTSIDFSWLHPGVYLLQASSSGTDSIAKLVITQ